jgi:hypothetical protein
MTVPNFIVIGAAKAGTTALHYILDQHPEIFMCPMKEPSFFWAYGREVVLKGPGAQVLKHRYVDDWSQYQELFAKVSGEAAIGESSVRYLSYPHSPELIHRFIPEVRLVAILRNPAERAFSSYTHYLRDGMEPCGHFGEAIEQELRGERDGWTFGRYLNQGLYHAALERYLQYFDRRQMYIALYEDLQDDANAFLRSLFAFLGVDEDFRPDMTQRHNVSGIIRNPMLRWIWTRSNSLRAALRPLLAERVRHAAFEKFMHGQDLEKPAFPNDVRTELNAFYREDILSLQDFLQRDLSRWLKPAEPA